MVIAHTHVLDFWRLRQKDCMFKTRLDYTEKIGLKNKKRNQPTLAHTSAISISMSMQVSTVSSDSHLLSVMEEF